MPLYYFHVENGQILHDEMGVEFPDIAAAQGEALGVCGDLLNSGPNATVSLWNGIPWRIWVTDKPNGEGKTLLTLRFSAET